MNEADIIREEYSKALVELRGLQPQYGDWMAKVAKDMLIRTLENLPSGDDAFRVSGFVNQCLIMLMMIGGSANEDFREKVDEIMNGARSRIMDRVMGVQERRDQKAWDAVLRMDGAV